MLTQIRKIDLINYCYVNNNADKNEHNNNCRQINY